MLSTSHFPLFSVSGGTFTLASFRTLSGVTRADCNASVNSMTLSRTRHVTIMLLCLHGWWLPCYMTVSRHQGTSTRHGVRPFLHDLEWPILYTYLFAMTRDAFVSVGAQKGPSLLTHVAVVFEVVVSGVHGAYEQQRLAGEPARDEGVLQALRCSARSGEVSPWEVVVSTADNVTQPSVCINILRASHLKRSIQYWWI